MSLLLLKKKEGKFFFVVFGNPLHQELSRHASEHTLPPLPDIVSVKLPPRTGLADFKNNYRLHNYTYLVITTHSTFPVPPPANLQTDRP